MPSCGRTPPSVSKTRAAAAVTFFSPALNDFWSDCLNDTKGQRRRRGKHPNRPSNGWSWASNICPGVRSSQPVVLIKSRQDAGRAHHALANNAFLFAQVDVIVATRNGAVTIKALTADGNLRHQRIGEEVLEPAVDVYTEAKMKCSRRGIWMIGKTSKGHLVDV